MWWQAPIDRRVDKNAVVHTYDGMLLSHKKNAAECVVGICDNMDGPREYYVKWNMSAKDKYILILLICGI